jgi:hypothetical protein
MPLNNQDSLRSLAAFGSQRDRYGTAPEVQQFGGIAPVLERSGKSDSQLSQTSAIRSS